MGGGARTGRPQPSSIRPTASAEPAQLSTLRLAADHGVRIADRHGRDLDLLAVEVEPLRLTDVDDPDVEDDLAVTPHVGCRLSTADADLHFRLADPAREPCGDDAGAVAGELRRRTVRIPDPDVGSRAGGGEDLEHSVGTNAEVVVAESPNRVRRQRRRQLSLLDEQVVVAERVPLR